MALASTESQPGEVWQLSFWGSMQRNQLPSKLTGAGGQAESEVDRKLTQ